MAIVNGLAMPGMSSASATGPVPSSNGSSPTEIVYEMPIKTVNAVIQEIFAVGLTLASCAKMATGPTADRLATAIDRLDAIIADLRKAAFRVCNERDGDPVAVAGGHVGETALDEIIGRLTAVGGTISNQAVTAAAGGCSSIHLLDAGHSLYRALIDLTAEPICDSSKRPGRAWYLTPCDDVPGPKAPTNRRGQPSSPPNHL